MAQLEAEAALEKITVWLRELYGERLQSLLAYGSVAGGNHRGKRSDLNLLAVLDRVDAATLDHGAPAVRWWKQQGHPPLVVLSREEQNNSADVFPIEYLDIHNHHRVLHGEDVFAAIARHPEQHRLQVEHDLRTRVLRLRGIYMGLGDDAKGLEALLLDSVSSFLTLFRHALVAVGEPLVIHKDAVLRAAAARFHFDPGPILQVMQAHRSGERLAGGKLPALRGLFAAYLAAVMQVEHSLEVSEP